VRASLADQSGLQVDNTLAIGLGANLPGPAGGPLNTLVAVRPRLVQSLCEWLRADRCGDCMPGLDRWHWSPLFETAPLGGPEAQPRYINALVLLELPADWLASVTVESALQLLTVLQQLENTFGRERLERWGPRSLDLDLLWIGSARFLESALELPHPRLLDRAFVLAPLAAVAPQLLLKGVDMTEKAAHRRLDEVLVFDSSQSVSALSAVIGWPEA